MSQKLQQLMTQHLQFMLLIWKLHLMISSITPQYNAIEKHDHEKSQERKAKHKYKNQRQKVKYEDLTVTNVQFPTIKS